MGSRPWRGLDPLRALLLPGAGAHKAVLGGDVRSAQGPIEDFHFVELAGETITVAAVYAPDAQIRTHYGVDVVRGSPPLGQRLQDPIDVKLVGRYVAIGEFGHHVVPAVGKTGRGHSVQVAIEGVEAERAGVEKERLRLPTRGHYCIGAVPVHPESDAGLGAGCSRNRQSVDVECAAAEARALASVGLRRRRRRRNRIDCTSARAVAPGDAVR